MKRSRAAETLHRSDFTRAPLLLWRTTPEWRRPPMPLWRELWDALCCLCRRLGPQRLTPLPTDPTGDAKRRAAGRSA